MKADARSLDYASYDEVRLMGFALVLRSSDVVFM